MRLKYQLYLEAYSSEPGSGYLSEENSHMASIYGCFRIQDRPTCMHTHRTALSTACEQLTFELLLLQHQSQLGVYAYPANYLPVKWMTVKWIE